MQQVRQPFDALERVVHSVGGEEERVLAHVELGVRADRHHHQLAADPADAHRPGGREEGDGGEVQRGAGADHG